MAQFVTELGTALEVAFKANTDLRLCFPDPAGSSAYAVEYNAQRTEFLQGVPQCFIRPTGKTTPQQAESSARSIFSFEAWCQLKDVKGVSGRLDQCMEGVSNVFKDNGSAILDTHLTDSGSNRLFKSGECRVTPNIDPLEVVDPDQPIVRLDIEIELTHANPLV